MPKDSHSFASNLLSWSEDIDRQMPWKEDTDPYKIWISEVILQQTTVKQGTPYFLRFIEALPDVYSLAAADENTVLKLWEGLGYYSRARNLHSAARYIVNELDGVFPKSYQELLQLKGVGPYTAAAVSSFAYEETQPVIDGNVLRFLSRYLGNFEPIDTALGRKIINDFASKVIKHGKPSKINQALMDFGALMCKPSSPECESCPFKKDCLALEFNSFDKLPVKSPKAKRKNLYFYFMEILTFDGFVMIEKRLADDIWKGLYQFPALVYQSKPKGNIENTIREQVNELFKTENKFSVHKITPQPLKQILTHRNVYGTFYRIVLSLSHQQINQDLCLVERTNIRNFAFPKIVTQYLEEYGNK